MQRGELGRVVTLFYFDNANIGGMGYNVTMYGNGEDMKEIKFRAWNKKTQKMLYLQEITTLVLNTDIPGVFIPYHEDLVIMQYTGLKDQNGKEIYEEDILSSYVPGRTFKNIIANLNLENSNSFLMFYVKFITIGKLNIEKEIIGNIYENPELLETVNE